MKIIKISINGKRDDHGFMLLEMMLAIVIFYLLISLSWPLLSTNNFSAQLDGYSNQITTLLRNARMLAIKNGHDVVANVDISQRRVFLDESKAINLPQDIGIEILSSDDCKMSSLYFIIIFRPDGTNCGGVIRLWRGGHFFKIKVNWLTGAIRAEGE